MTELKRITPRKQDVAVGVEDSEVQVFMRINVR